MVAYVINEERFVEGVVMAMNFFFLCRRLSIFNQVKSSPRSVAKQMSWDWDHRAQGPI